MLIIFKCIICREKGLQVKLREILSLQSPPSAAKHFSIFYFIVLVLQQSALMFSCLCVFWFLTNNAK